MAKLKKSKSRKKLSKLKSELWTRFSLFIKLKYSKDGKTVNCFTCGRELTIGRPDCHGGHYYPKGGYGFLYFHENNVRPQCYRCNIGLEGNTQVFREKLIEEIGELGVKELDDSRHGQFKMNRTEYVVKIELYNKKIEELLKNFEIGESSYL